MLGFRTTKGYPLSIALTHARTPPGSGFELIHRLLVSLNIDPSIVYFHYLFVVRS